MPKQFTTPEQAGTDDKLIKQTVRKPRAPRRQSPAAPAAITVRRLWRLYHSAQGLLRKGHVDQARQLFSQIAEAPIKPTSRQAAAPVPPRLENPLVTPARLGLFYCFIEQGKLEDATAQVELVLARDPHNPDALCEHAYILGLRGLRDQALAALKTAAARNPRNARVHKSLGHFYLQEDDIPRAVAECKAAIRCDAGYDQAHVGLAVALSRAGRFDEALKSMRRAMQLCPHNVDYCYTLAALLRETRRNHEAAKVLQFGLRSRPDDSRLLEAIAELKLETGDTAEAIQYAQKLLRISGNSLSARDVLGVAYLQQGRIHEALRMADQMVTISPMDPSHHFKKAVLFQQQGMVREALTEFVQVLNLAPDTDMGLEASVAVDALDHQQMRQVMLLAMEDPIFRTQLRRNPVGAATERGFHLSENGMASLQSLDVDSLSPSYAASRLVQYH